MNKNILSVVVTALALTTFFGSCDPVTSGKNVITADSTIIAGGELSFNQNCSGCHNFKLDGIGPQLSSITKKIPKDWLLRFIKNSSEVIASGDTQAVQLFNHYKKAVMPSFDGLSADELNSLLAFINIHAQTVSPLAEKSAKDITNPIPESIALSTLTINLQPVTQFPPSNNKSPFTRITKLSFQPVTGNLFINDLQGKLYKMKVDKPVVYLDMKSLKPKFINQPGLATGFGSFAFHPGFGGNGLLYTTHTEAPGSAKADFSYADSIKVSMQWILTEWKTHSPNADTFSGSSRELLRVNMVTGMHGMQEITFNPLSKPGDKDYSLLYIGIGDGGSVEEGYGFLAHSIEKIWGTIIRINPMGNNSSNGHYGIPPGNPFANHTNSKLVKEIYAFGFRNPHRITWTQSGNMLASNIGQANIESINLVMPGHDYGWPIREGNFAFGGTSDNLGNIYPLPANDSIYKITYPVAEFDHDEGKAISGGFEYGGNAIPELKGKFLFGDIPSGRLFYTDVTAMHLGKMATIKEWKITINGYPRTLKEACGSDRVDLHFGRDMQGELYILTKADGKVYKMVSATIKPLL